MQNVASPHLTEIVIAKWHQISDLFLAAEDEFKEDTQADYIGLQGLRLSAVLPQEVVSGEEVVPYLGQRNMLPQMANSLQHGLDLIEQAPHSPHVVSGNALFSHTTFICTKVVAKQTHNREIFDLPDNLQYIKKYK